MKNKWICAAAAAMVVASCGSRNESQAQPEVLTILAGSYAAAGDTAVRLLEFNPATAELRLVEGTAVPRSASYFVQAPNGAVYGVSEGPADVARAWAMRVNPAGIDRPRLELIDTVAVGSASPCYLSVSPDGRFAVTANYDGATVTIFPIDSATGAVGAPVQTLRFEGSGPMKGRQDSSHPHCAIFTPDGRYLMVNDLGTDRISLFDLAAPGADTLVNPASRRDVELLPGSGPRHTVFDAAGTTAYLINELSDSVTVLGYDGTTLTPRQYAAANPEPAHGAADIHLSPDGRHLYASLRLTGEGIAQFDVDSITGNVTYAGHTATNPHPRNFMLTPDGRYMLVASRDAGTVEVLEIDPSNGSLTPRTTLQGLPGVVCLKLIN